MATDFVIGGFGSGKSYEGLCQIYNELIYTERPVVTNLAVFPEKLHALISKRFPEKHVQVLERIRLLTEEEVSYFFCHRIAQPGLYEYDIPVPSEDEQKKGKRPDFTLWRDCGILFVIDEFHDFFNNRSWAEIGRAVGWYKNQQRKLSDDIVAITPNIEEVEKQIRQTGKQYVSMTNLRDRKFKGVALPGVFVKTVYPSLAACKRQSGGERSYITIDLELAACYDTARGVRGIQGKRADIDKKRGGIPWHIALGCFLLFVAVLFFGLRWAGQVMFKHGVSHLEAHSGQKSPDKVRTGPHSAAAGNVLQKGSILTAASEMQTTETNQSDLYCTGYLIFYGQPPQANLSDGTVVGPPDLQLIAKYFIIVNGRRIPIRLTRPDYVPEPVPQYDLPPPAPDRPVNDIQVTVIGKDHRQAPPRLGGLKQMQQQFSQ